MKKLAVVTLIPALLFLTSPVYGATITVCPSGCNYTDIQMAYNNSNCGDIVEIRSNGLYDTYLIFNKNCTAGNSIIVKNGAGYIPVITSTISTSWTTGISLSGSYNTIDGIKVKDLYHGNAVYVSGNYNTIQNCTFDNIDYKDMALGNCADAVWLDSSSNIVQNCTFLDANHGSLLIYQNPNSTRPVRYNQIINNTFYNKYGHGVSILGNAAQYNLIDGNTFRDHGSLSTNAAKSGIQISGGQNNSIRRNVFYDIYNRAMEISSYSIFTNNTANNLIYNNTFYNIPTRPSSGTTLYWIKIGNGGGTYNVTNNRFYNNIADKIGKQLNTEFFNTYAAWVLYYVNENDAGDNLAQITFNNWNGNYLVNNSIRHYQGGSYDVNYPYAIQYVNSGSTYHGYWSVTGVNGIGSMSGNITTDCQLVSTDTSQPGWWYLKGTSPCINAGIVVNDTNASVGGWSQLTYTGSAPDIGAYEYAGVNPPAPSPSPPPGDASAPAPPTGLTITPQ